MLGNVLLQDNPALSFATNNHEFVSAIYIYDKKDFDNIREAQKWWISKSLKSLNEDLLKNNISLEIIEDNQINFFKKFKSKDIAVYWNKIYEPEIINLGKKIRDNVLLNIRKIKSQNKKIIVPIT